VYGLALIQISFNGTASLRPNALPFSCRLAAFANATDAGNEMDSNAQKSSDLVRRKAVSWNGLFGGPRHLAFSYRSPGL
jgi:hypothetical protein